MTTSAVESNTAAITTKIRENEIVTSIIKFDIVGHLPAEIAQQILFGLSPEDLHSATLCCESWSAAINDDYFWRRRCKSDGHLEVEESERSEFYNNFLTKYNYWQGVYWYNYTLQRNWETNNYREVIHEIKQSDVIAMGLWNFGDVIAFSQCDRYGSNICIRDLKREKQTVFRIPNDTGEYTDLLRSGNYFIYTVPGDYIILLWDFVNGTTIFEYHCKMIDYVLADVQVDKNLIVLMYEMDFEVYNIETRETEYDYTGKVENLILEDGKIIFTKNNVINILKWHDKSIVPITCCQSVYDRKLLVKNDLLLSFCQHDYNYMKTVCIWCTVTNTKLHSTLLGSMPAWSCKSLIGKYLYAERRSYCAEYDYIIAFWDYMKGTQEADIVARINKNVHSSSNDHFLVASYPLHIWCLRTRNFISIPNITLDPEDQFDTVLSKTKLTCVLRTSNEAHMNNTITIHQRDYEI